MKVLYLLRHAKSSWKDATLSDHARPLNGRGRRAAKVIGEFLERYICSKGGSKGPAPDLVLCSSAVRTRETLDILLDAAPEAIGGVEVDIDGALYHSAPAELLDRLKRMPDDVSTVLLIGHNPGLELLALGLAGGQAGDTGEGTSLDHMAAKFPTAALAVLEADIGSWHDLDPGGTLLRLFIRPKDISD